MEAVMPTPLSSRHDQRPEAPAHVWDWQAYPRWKGAVWELLSDTVDQEVRQAFLDDPPQYVVYDNMGWLDEIIWSARQIDVDSKELLADRLKRRFAAFRAFHGTRADDLGAFYAKGLLPLDPDAAHLRAKEIFLGGDFPELTPEALEAAIREVGTDTREGRVYFDGNEQLLIEDCGHYMLYGSEYVVGIAAHLKGPRDYRQTLKRRGEPVVFVCDVPFALMGHGTLLEFAGMALASVFQELLDGSDYQPDQSQGAGFSIRQALPRECIAGHYHPVIIRDPIA